MNALNYINLGEKAINVIYNEKKAALNTILSGKVNRVTKVSLGNDYFVDFAKTPHYDKKNVPFTIDGIQNWTLDIVHKIKKQYEIVSLTLKENGRDIIRGAFSRAKDGPGEVKKYHFTYDDILLQTGHTNPVGNLKMKRRISVVPEKYKDYMWCLSDKSLQILSDFYGIFGKAKSVEEICSAWNIKPYKVKLLRLEAMSELQNKMKEGMPSMRKTASGRYTLEDFVNALTYLKESPEYNFMTGNIETNTNTLIDDVFLDRIKTVRKCMDIVKEWHEDTAFLKENKYPLYKKFSARYS